MIRNHKGQPGYQVGTQTMGALMPIKRSSSTSGMLRADPAAQTTQTAAKLCSALPEKQGCKH